MQKTFSRSYKIFILAAAIFCIGLFYFIFDPMESKFMPQCIFHHFTGLQCIGCGTQRMAHYLLHGEIAEAFKANALVTLSIPFIIFLLWLELTRLRHPKLYSRVFSIPVIWTIAGILILWLIIRNIIGI